MFNVVDIVVVKGNRLQASTRCQSAQSLLSPLSATESMACVSIRKHEWHIEELNRIFIHL